MSHDILHRTTARCDVQVHGGVRSNPNQANQEVHAAFWAKVTVGERYGKIRYLTTIPLPAMFPLERAVWERLVRGGDDPTELDALLDAMPMPFFQD